MNTRLPLPSRSAPLALRLATACLLIALGTTTALAAPLTSLDEFNAGKARAEAELLADRAACDKLAGNPRDVCREQASGRERVTRAELDLAHTGTRRSQDKVIAVKLDTAYDIARTQCNDKAGGAKTLCTKQAQAALTKGQADLKRSQRATDARRDADHKVAAEKCDATAADTRAACLAAAKAKAGKT